MRTAKGMILSRLGGLQDSTFSFPTTVVCSVSQPSMSTSFGACPGWQFLYAFERKKNGKRVESRVSPPMQVLQFSRSPLWAKLGQTCQSLALLVIISYGEMSTGRSVRPHSSGSGKALPATPGSTPPQTQGPAEGYLACSATDSKINY